MQKLATYHKEALRQDLLLAARAYVSQHGHASLSLRSLAAHLGVTTSAPYHHFADRRALLLEVAMAGFSELIGNAEQIAQSQDVNCIKLSNLARSFLTFANKRPRLLELMYESELTTPTIDPVLFAFQDRGHRSIVSIIKDARPQSSIKQVDLKAIVFWSMIYGYALIRNKLLHKPHELLNETSDNLDEVIADEAVKMALS